MKTEYLYKLNRAEEYLGVPKTKKMSEKDAEKRLKLIRRMFNLII